jgi:hypothetical protein
MKAAKLIKSPDETSHLIKTVAIVRGSRRGKAAVSKQY